MIRYNVGCGKRNWPGWFGVDGVNFPHIVSNDIYLNIVSDNYIDLIYSSHLIAYLSRDEVKVLFKAWFERLKPGGTLRIATPDFNILSKFYQCELPLDRITGPLYGRMEMNGKEIYHKTTWDFKSLVLALEDVGFNDIKVYDHTKTEHPNTGNREDFYDDHSAAYINGTLISLNVEANKPL